MNPEKALLRTIEREEEEESLENLREFLKQASEKMRKEGVPVRPNCRIEMDEFKEVYDVREIERDKQEIQKWEETSKRRLGEQLEMLKTGVFNKFLPDNFVAVRASRFDDIKNSADNVVIDRQSGSVVCALDEVGEIQGERFEEKKEQVLDKNNKGGVILKYALTVKDGQIMPSRAVQGIPIFYLALSPEFIRRGIREFISSPDKPPSDYERKIFDYFISSIDTQIKAIELNRNLKKALRERIKYFKKAIGQIRH